MILQKDITLPFFSRGFHIITDIIIREIDLPQLGLLHLFVKHTSAGLTINENFDSSVLNDFETFFNKMVPETSGFFTHTEEGPDDMPSHIKASMVGSSVSIPITNGKLNLGTWQGIYLCEFRNGRRARKITATIIQ
jgi:secondary thiamine-phosphate synthase enzyme